MSPQVVYFGIQETLTLSRDGVWLSNGQEITHEATVRAFFKFLHRDESGQWCIRIGQEQKPVTIEDTPAFVKAVMGSPTEGYRIRLLGKEETEEFEELEAGTLSYSPGRLTCRIGSGWEARFLRGPYHELLRSVSRDEKGYYLKIKGARIDLMADPAPF